MALLLKNLLFTLVVPGTVAGWAPWRLAREAARADGSRWVAALVAFALGALVFAWCVWDFATFGRGTPAPLDPPKRLVVRGLYRVVRNPMFVGILLVLLGWALAYPGPRLAGYAALVALAFHLFVVLFEEPFLRRTFGAAYDDYRARVPRWRPTWPPAPPTGEGT